MNILIADDEEGFRKMLCSCFEMDPTHQVVSVKNALEAWWELSEPEARFDIGIFDIKMPGITGFDLLKRVRGCAKTRNLPVIMCSGINDRATVVQSGQLAANYYLVKPFKLQVLMDKVHELCSNRRVANSATLAPVGSGISASPMPRAI